MPHIAGCTARSELHLLLISKSAQDKSKKVMNCYSHDLLHLPITNQTDLLFNYQL